MSSVSKGRWKGICPEVEGPTESTPKSVATFEDDTGLSLKSNPGVVVDDDQNLKVTEADVLIEGVTGPRGLYWSDGTDLASILYVPASSRLIVSSDTDLYLSSGDQLFVNTAAGWHVEGISYTRAQIQDLFTIAGTSPATNDLLRWDGSGWAVIADSTYAAAGHDHGTGTDNEIARWDQATGFQGSGWAIEDSGLMTAPVAVDGTPVYSATRYSDGSAYGTIGVLSTGPTFRLSASGTMAMQLEAGGALALSGDGIGMASGGTMDVLAAGNLALMGGTGGTGDVLITAASNAGKLVFSTQALGKWSIEGTEYTRDQVQDLFAMTDNAQGDLFFADATDSISRLPKDTGQSRYLSNQGANNAPLWGQVNLANGVMGSLPFANLTQGAARSVLGVSGNSSAAVNSIQGTADQVLRVNGAGTSLAFGALDLSKAAAVTGLLGFANLANLAGFSLFGKASTGSGTGSSLAVGADSLVGRAGSGNIGDITCTQAGRALLDDSTGTDQLRTLGILFAVKSGSTERVNTNTPTSDPHLTVTVPEGKRFLVLHGHERWADTADPDLKLGFTVPSGATMFWNFAGTTTKRDETTYDTPGLTSAHTVALFWGSLESGDGGTFAVSWSQNVLDATDGTWLGTGSWLLLIPLE